MLSSRVCRFQVGVHPCEKSCCASESRFGNSKTYSRSALQIAYGKTVFLVMSGLDDVLFFLRSASAAVPRFAEGVLHAICVWKPSSASPLFSLVVLHTVDHFYALNNEISPLLRLGCALIEQNRCEMIGSHSRDWGSSSEEIQISIDCRCG